MGEAWFKLLMLPVVVVVTFGLFSLTLVVIAFGYGDPSGTPGTELRRLGRYLGAGDRWLRAPRI
jgi:hypothetical protein